MKNAMPAGRQAFSLVELIVVVAIAMLLAGIGAAAVNSFTLSRKIDTVTGELVAQLKLARNMAITNQLPVGVSGDLSYVKVDIASDFTVTASAYNKDKTGILTNIGTFFTKKIESTSGLVLTVSPISSFGFWGASGRLIDTTGGKSDFTDGPIIVNVGIVGDEDQKKITISDLGMIDQ
jgi:type II secretory pathway pseudopilin PulG